MKSQEENLSRVLNEKAVEYVEKLKGESRQRWEMIDVLRDLASDIYEEESGRLDDKKLREIARKYNLSNGDSKHISELAERLKKADGLLSAASNIDAVLYGLYGIAKKEEGSCCRERGQDPFFICRSGSISVAYVRIILR